MFLFVIMEYAFLAYIAPPDTMMLFLDTLNAGCVLVIIIEAKVKFELYVR